MSNVEAQRVAFSQHDFDSIGVLLRERAVGWIVAITQRICSNGIFEHKVGCTEQEQRLGLANTLTHCVNSVPVHLIHFNVVSHGNEGLVEEKKR